MRRSSLHLPKPSLGLDIALGGTKSRQRHHYLVWMEISSPWKGQPATSRVEVPEQCLYLERDMSSSIGDMVTFEKYLIRVWSSHRRGQWMTMSLRYYGISLLYSRSLGSAMERKRSSVNEKSRVGDRILITHQRDGTLVISVHKDIQWIPKIISRNDDWRIYASVCRFKVQYHWLVDHGS